MNIAHVDSKIHEAITVLNFVKDDNVLKKRKKLYIDELNELKKYKYLFED